MSSHGNDRVACVESVLGPVASTSLGPTLIHEHLIINLRCYWSPSDDPDTAFELLTRDTADRVRANPFAVRDNLAIDDPQVLAGELLRFKEAGGGTIVDVTPDGIGRDPRTLAWLAETAGINVIAGTGYYIKETHPSGMAGMSKEELADEMVRDLTLGIRGTSTRAGVIGEIGMSGFPMDPAEQKVLEAAAHAQEQVGCAIVAHSAPGAESPFEVATVLRSTNVDMSRVVQSHLDERFRADITRFQELASFGINLGFDTFGRELYYEDRERWHPKDHERIDALLSVLDAGLIDQVILGQDICLKHELATYGGHGYDHVLSSIVPQLRDRGVSDAEIDQMIRLNPARILVG